MNPASLLLLAAACNLDNIVVGIAYGSRQIRVPFSSNLFIAVITASGTLLSLLSGRVVFALVRPSFAHALGSVAIMLVGAWIVLQEAARWLQDGDTLGPVRLLHVEKIEPMNRLICVLENPVIGAMSVSGVLTRKEGALLGLALTLNNLPTGLAAGLAGTNPIVLAATLVVFSMLTLSLGMYLGRRFASVWLRDAAGPLAGVLLLTTGIFELFI
ncbi:MAG: hypothetical protein HPY55_13200 [Firmicutes bacterium]|nr:hypothetical protein [Bacillota bacterium]